LFKVQSLRCSIACGVQGSIASLFNCFAVQGSIASLFNGFAVQLPTAFKVQSLRCSIALLFKGLMASPFNAGGFRCLKLLKS